jgi:hypothetical protein
MVQHFNAHVLRPALKNSAPGIESISSREIRAEGMIQDAAKMKHMETRRNRRVRFAETCSYYHRMQGIESAKSWSQNCQRIQMHVPSPKIKIVVKALSNRNDVHTISSSSSRPFSLDIDNIFDTRNFESAFSNVSSSFQSAMAWTNLVQPCK